MSEIQQVQSDLLNLNLDNNKDEETKEYQNNSLQIDEINQDQEDFSQILEELMSDASWNLFNHPPPISTPSTSSSIDSFSSPSSVTSSSSSVASLTSPTTSTSAYSSGPFALHLLTIFFHSNETEAYNFLKLYKIYFQECFSIPQLAIKVTQFVGEILKIIPSKISTSKVFDLPSLSSSNLTFQEMEDVVTNYTNISFPSILTSISENNIWSLLNNSELYQTLFNISMLYFFDLIKEEIYILEKEKEKNNDKEFIKNYFNKNNFFNQIKNKIKSFLWEIMIQKPRTMKQLYKSYENVLEIKKKTFKYINKNNSACINDDNYPNLLSPSSTSVLAPSDAATASIAASSASTAAATTSSILSPTSAVAEASAASTLLASASSTNINTRNRAVSLSGTKPRSMTTSSLYESIYPSEADQENEVDDEDEEDEGVTIDEEDEDEIYTKNRSNSYSRILISTSLSKNADQMQESLLSNDEIVFSRSRASSINSDKNFLRGGKSSVGIYSTLSTANSHLSENEYYNITEAISKQQLELSVVQRKIEKKSLKNFSNILGGSKILSPEQIEELEYSLPINFQHYDWKLNYRLSLHGASISTLYGNSINFPASILVLKDSKGAIFGAFLSDFLRNPFAGMESGEYITTSIGRFYGNGNVGVFTFALNEKDEVSLDNEESNKIKYYNWTYSNNYFISNSNFSLGVGGGGGNFALCVDSDLASGTSGPCPTFNSPCLASSETFEINACELFGFVPHS